MIAHCDFVGYQEAVDFCAANYGPNAALAAPVVQSDFSSVQNAIKSECRSSRTNVDYVWLGFFIDEGNACYGSTFLSMGTCQPATADQLNWASGQPDGPGTELCVAQGVTNGGGAKLHDYSCATTLPFVCQIYASSFADTCASASGSCPPPPGGAISPPPPPPPPPPPR